mgnify:CR=1 FL=1
MTPEHLPTEQYEAQLAEKVVRLQSMMAPFSDLVPEVFRSPVSHYRMRAEFRIWHDGDDLYHIIFDQQTKSRIRVDSFPAASELINQLMTAMIAGVRNNPVLRHKLFQIDYLTTLSNQAVVSLLYHKKLDDEWRQEAEALRDALRAQNLNVQRLYEKAFDQVMISPTPLWQFIVGQVIAGSLRGLYAGCVIMLLILPIRTGLVFNGFSFLIMFLNGAVFSTIAVVVSFIAKNHTDVPRFSNYVIMPMSYLCNTFFSMDNMPEGIRQVIGALPLSQTSAMIRSIAKRQAINPVGILILAIYLVVFLFLSFWFIYKRKNL